MIIRKYGVALHRLREEHLELLREHRNSAVVAKRMFYQDHITPDMQKVWYKKMYSIYHYYFMIEYQGKWVGLIHGKNVNYKKKESEGGIFIWDDSCWDSFVPVMATVCLADITFSLFELKRTYADVRVDNNRALQYNLQLGYVIENENKEEGRIRLVLTEANYLARIKKIRRTIQQLCGEGEAVTWTDFDLSGVSSEERKQLYTGFPPKLQTVVDAKIEGKL
jgi:RimJ/RimL family protein N-acetyltransferase